MSIQIKFGFDWRAFFENYNEIKDSNKKRLGIETMKIHKFMCFVYN